MSDFKIKDLMIPIFPNSDEMQGEIGACGACTCSCSSCGTCTCSCGSCGSCTMTHSQWRSVEEGPHVPDGPSLDMAALKAELAKHQGK